MILLTIMLTLGVIRDTVNQKFVFHIVLLILLHDSVVFHEFLILIFIYWLKNAIIL